MAVAAVTSFAPTGAIRAGVVAPSLIHVGQRVRYRVTVTGAGKAGATSVRLCTSPPRRLIAVHAPGTVAFNGQRCRTVAASDGGAR